MIYKVIDLNVKTEGKNPDYTATLTTYIHSRPTSQGPQKRPAVIVCPGGGYRNTVSHEGEPIALKFIQEGICAFVLNYSVEPATFPQALCELAEAIKIVRENAEEWKIDPDKIMTCGFSAGGHLAASIGVFYNKPVVLDVLKCSAEEIKPNGMILCYPVIKSSGKTHKPSFERLLGDKYDELLESVSLEKLVNETTPPAFLWHTYEDQAVPVENSMEMFAALRNHNVNAELHIYPHGGHGAALGTEVAGALNSEIVGWMDLAIRWAKNL